MLRIVAFLVVAFFPSSMFASTVVFEADFKGVITKAGFTPGLVYNSDGEFIGYTNSYSSYDLGIDQSSIEGLDVGEFVSGTLRVTEAQFGYYSVDCDFEIISYNACGGLYDAQGIDFSSNFEISGGNPVSSSITVGISDGFGVLSYIDDGNYGDSLDNGLIWFADNGFSFTMVFVYQSSSINEVPLPATMSFFSVFAFFMLFRSRRDKKC